MGSGYVMKFGAFERPTQGVAQLLFHHLDEAFLRDCAAILALYFVDFHTYLSTY